MRADTHTILCLEVWNPVHMAQHSGLLARQELAASRAPSRSPVPDLGLCVSQDSRESLVCRGSRSGLGLSHPQCPRTHSPCSPRPGISGSRD